ncbi:hypothetical protein DPMN_193811 [Dreissena polymorpha]|uniref:Uncharacterized protein n=1 Tax=Dreissena polymorpha TaxID=45954 RepID=A0A9D3Y6A4_DREPO|nr:hypothetical protein DPMN_193811 [Dreissena polymorpha]
MKQQVHEEKERKDGEILRSRSQAQSLGQENMQLKKRIEKLETDRQIAIAEVKQQVHEEKERKDGEILRLRSQAQSLGQEKTQLKERIEKLEKASTNQLEKARANQLGKARAIFKRLKADVGGDC